MGILRTSLLEIGNWVQADQRSDRVGALSNNAVFKDPVLNYTQEARYIDAVADYTNEVAAPAKIALQQLPGMSLTGSPEIHAQVYVSLTEHWIAGTLRYVVHARSRRTVTHQLQAKTLKALAGAGIPISSPALTLVRYPAERTWEEEA